MEVATRARSERNFGRLCLSVIFSRQALPQEESPVKSVDGWASVDVAPVTPARRVTTKGGGRDVKRGKPQDKRNETSRGKVWKAAADMNRERRRVRSLLRGSGERTFATAAGLHDS